MDACRNSGLAKARIRLTWWASRCILHGNNGRFYPWEL